jgi:large subunit ribosomal protein L17
VVFSYLKDKEAVSELFREISPKVGERPGGYTRILKIGNRIGDNAEMCILELVDYNEAMMGGGEAAKTKTARRRRSPKKKTDAAVTEKTVKASEKKAEEKTDDAETALEEQAPEEEK